jgi:class 3 adenylate cyclase
MIGTAQSSGPEGQRIIAVGVASLAQPGEVLVTRTVHDLVAGSGLRFAQRGTHKLKGVPGDWELLAVSADTTPA